MQDKISELLKVSQRYQELLQEVLLDLQTGIYTPTRKGSIVLTNTKTGNTEEYSSVEQASNNSGVTVKKIESIIDTSEDFLGYKFKHKGYYENGGVVKDELVTGIGDDNEYNIPDSGVRYDSILVEYPNGEQTTVSTIKEASDIVGCPRTTLSNALHRDGAQATVKNGYKVVAQLDTVQLP